MKKYLLFILLLANSFLSAAQDKEIFYAIDGSEWVSEGLRDDRENSLWEELHFNIHYLRIADKECSIQIDRRNFAGSLQDLAVVIEEAIRYSRQQNEELEELLTPQVNEYLQEKDILLIPSQAKNKEAFVMEELCSLYNSYLEGFDFLYRTLNEISDPMQEKLDLTSFMNGKLNLLVEDISSRTKTFKNKAYTIREITIE